MFFRSNHIKKVKSVNINPKALKNVLPYEELYAEKIGYKIRSAQMQKIPYMVIVGENEANNGTISIRKRGNVEIKDLQTKDLVKEMKKLIETRALEC